MVVISVPLWGGGWTETVLNQGRVVWLSLFSRCSYNSFSHLVCMFGVISPFKKAAIFLSLPEKSMSAVKFLASPKSLLLARGHTVSRMPFASHADAGLALKSKASFEYQRTVGDG